jgi:hypothetical protein
VKAASFKRGERPDVALEMHALAGRNSIRVRWWEVGTMTLRGSRGYFPLAVSEG